MIISSTQNGYLGLISSFRTLENLILGPFLEHLHFTPARGKRFLRCLRSRLRTKRPFPASPCVRTNFTLVSQASVGKS